MKKLTEKEAIAALKKLEKQWPKDLWLFAANGTLCLMRKHPNERKEAGKPGSGMDRELIAESFPGIECDGGDW